jgi:hypothetical protein
MYVIRVSMDSSNFLLTRSSHIDITIIVLLLYFFLLYYYYER